MRSHKEYMQRCFDLALKGLGKTAPNPLVGCVIVNGGKIIGEGFHHAYGDHHAEVNAINSVADKALLKKSTLYVNLEPCAHYGKTPPCADLIVKHQLKRVVICNKDPFSKVDGRGIERLEKAGIEVIADVLKSGGHWLNRRFFTFHQDKRPYVILKWAQTKDGYIDNQREPNDGAFPLKITSNASNLLVHKWRSEESAILVGKNTALLDNPRLTNRHWPGNQPLRIVFDKDGALPVSLNIFDGESPTIVFGKTKASTVEAIALEDSSTAIVQVFQELYHRQIQSVIIEGGANLLQQFIDTGSWDECRRFSSEKRIETGIKAPKISGRLIESIKIETDELQTIVPE